MITKNFKLKGLHCPACKKLTEKRIGSLAGVRAVTVDPETGIARVEADAEVTNGQISTVLKDTPYTVSS